jgi:hypothetical protein
MTDADLGYLASRHLPTGRWAVVIALTFGRARLCVQATYAAESYDDAW